MDQSAAVEDMILRGSRFLNQLWRDGFEVTVACWARHVEKEYWHLYIASPSVDANGVIATYPKLFEAQKQIPNTEFGPSELYLVAANSPFAQDALKSRPERAGPNPTKFQGWRLGDIPIDEAWIYPPAPIHLTPDEAVLRMVHLLQKQGVPRPALVSLRDGSAFEALPDGLDLSSHGLRNLRFVETASYQPRTLQAHEVVGID